MNKIRSLKGGACLRFEPCRPTASDRHNERQILRNLNNDIDPSLSYLNKEWKDETIPDLKIYWDSCVNDYNRHQVPKPRNNYNPKTKKHFNCLRREQWKKNMSAIKEGVLILKDGSIDSFEKALAVARELERKYHLKVLRVVMHADEYKIDKNGKQIFNYHAHIVVCWYDWKIHKPFALNDNDMGDIQDFAAKLTGLPRGNHTGKYIKGLSNLEYKIAMASIEANDARKEVLMAEYHRLIEQLKNNLTLVVDDPEWSKEREMVEVYEMKDEEIFHFEPMPQHPIAYSNCVDRFAERVEEIRRSTRLIESYLENENQIEMAYQEHEIEVNARTIKEQEEKLYKLQVLQQEALRCTPSPLQILRYMQDLRDQTHRDVQTILDKYDLTLKGMKRCNNDSGSYYENLQLTKRDGATINLHIFESTGQIYSVTIDGKYRNVNLMPELADYFRASISPEMRELLEDAYPVTTELKAKKEKKISKGISMR